MHAYNLDIYPFSPKIQFSTNLMGVGEGWGTGVGVDYIV